MRSPDGPPESGDQWVPLRAAVNRSPLPPVTYTAAGDHVYVQSVPAWVLQGRTTRVDFELDKALPPEESDRRERGVIVSFLGFE